MRITIIHQMITYRSKRLQEEGPQGNLKRIAAPSLTASKTLSSYRQSTLRKLRIRQSGTDTRSA